MSTSSIELGNARPLSTERRSNGTSQSRTALQRRAPSTIRRHFLRAAIRILVLVSGDVGTFVAVRALVRAVRDGGLWGERLGQMVSSALPSGFLGGWQFAVALLIGLAAVGAYKPGDRRRDIGRVFLGVALAAALALWHALWVNGIPPVLIRYVATVIVVGASVAVSRRVIDLGVNRFAAQLLPNERILFVGDPSLSVDREVAHKLIRAERMESVGWVTAPEGSAAEPVEHEGRLGGVDEIWDVLHEVDVETVVVCGQLEDGLFDILVEATAAAGCRLMAVSRYEGVGRLRPSLVWYYRHPFVELTVPALRGQHMLLKRIADFTGSALGLLLLAPLFAVIAMAIKLESQGPVLFSQERVGHGGRTFRMRKFRTMRDGADDEKDSVAHMNQSGDARLFKIRNDPRVTRVGRWLRRWSLDELPQLWNVLVGDMSLVGPRPFFETDLHGYSEHHFVRFGAKPGITGLWQIRGRSSLVDFDEVVRLDQEYIERWSILLDLEILLLTIPAVLRRTGAY